MDTRHQWLSRYYNNIRDDGNSHYGWLRKVTLSTSTETGQKESVKVLLQRSYTGNIPVIPSALANTTCSALGIRAMLDNLNTILGTSYSLRTSWVYSILGDCVLQKWDFGTAFAYLRPHWCGNLHTVVDVLPNCKVQDQEMRQDVLSEDRIIHIGVPPRRIWDLYSNRVVPWWVAKRWPWGISHAWTDVRDRENMMTPINGCQWPVPVPKDTSLDLVRIEMLNLGAEYAWLDVLCLRQEGGTREDLREEEWKVDVPTIGGVYNRGNGVACYLSGLGRPLTSDADNLEDERCWFKRAWTLQEISRNPIIGGDTGDVQLWEKFNKKLSSLQLTAGICDVLSEMRKRVSTNPVDKIAGMVYPLGSHSIPAYYGEQSEEDAWTVLLDEVWGPHLADLLFCYPEPGPKSWRPSWKQVMSETVPLRPTSLDWAWVKSSLIESVESDTWLDGYIIESALVRELSEEDSQGRKRHGTLVVEDKTGTQHTIEIVAYHQCLIPDGLYTLLGEGSMQYWVIGRRLTDQRFKKVSVFEFCDKYEEEDEDEEELLRSITTMVHSTILA